MKMFWAWTCVAPLAAFGTLWSLRDASPNIGYAMPFFVMAGAGLIVLLACVIGFFTTSFLASLGGALVGFPIAAALVWSYLNVVDWKNARALDIEEAALTQIAPAIKSESVETIARAFSEMKDLPVPVAVCRLASRELETPMALLIGGAVVKTTIPIEEKEAALYPILRHIAESRTHDAAIDNVSIPASFANWVALWRSAHGATDLKVLEVRSPYSKPDPYCLWPKTEDLSQSFITEWQDLGIEAWLENGLVFSGAQQRNALESVQSSRVLKRLIASGIDIHAPDARAGSGGIYTNTLLVQRSYSLYSLLNDAKDPWDVAVLIETLIEAGADPRIPSVDGKTPLQIFNETESYLPKNDSPGKSTQAQKLKAFNQIRRLLTVN